MQDISKGGHTAHVDKDDVQRVQSPSQNGLVQTWA